MVLEPLLGSRARPATNPDERSITADRERGEVIRRGIALKGGNRNRTQSVKMRFDLIKEYGGKCRFVDIA
jgi:hypothetical protein